MCVAIGGGFMGLAGKRGDWWEDRERVETERQKPEGSVRGPIPSGSSSLLYPRIETSLSGRSYAAYMGIPRPQEKQDGKKKKGMKSNVGALKEEEGRAFLGHGSFTYSDNAAWRVSGFLFRNSFL